MAHSWLQMRNSKPTRKVDNPSVQGRGFRPKLMGNRHVSSSSQTNLSYISTSATGGLIRSDRFWCSTPTLFELHGHTKQVTDLTPTPAIHAPSAPVIEHVAPAPVVDCVTHGLSVSFAAPAQQLFAACTETSHKCRSRRPARQFPKFKLLDTSKRFCRQLKLLHREHVQHTIEQTVDVPVPNITKQNDVVHQE